MLTVCKHSLNDYRAQYRPTADYRALVLFYSPSITGASFDKTT